MTRIPASPRWSNRVTPLAATLALTIASGFGASVPVVALSSGTVVPAGLAPTAAVGESATAPTATSSRERIAGENQSNFLPMDADGRTTYTVILKEPAVASYEGGLNGLAAVPKQRTGKHVGRPDLNSSEAQTYARHLEQVQGDFVADVAASIGRPLTASAQFQHALNAVMLSLTPAEADALGQRDDVQLVARERKRKLDTFASPTFIGAANLWNDSSAPNGVGYKGEGIVVGVIDSGVNYLSNSFKSPGDDGYAPVNPLGDGVYLGLCGPTSPNANLGHCTSKLIGMYNTESTATNRNGRDLDGHGSHTASTAAGGVVTNASFAGGTFTVSGVAPHANVITYLACYASCTDTVLIAAINQAVANNIVDVINYSIGGPNDGPWLDAIDQAYLNAMNAGIFVATAAGNDGPGEVTTDSYAPWYTSVGASTPNQLPGFSLTVQGWSGTATMIPGSTPYPTQAYTDLPLIESPTFADGSNDGCAAFPANYFRRPQTAGGAQGIAVLHLDQNASNCASGTRRTAAANAGALAVVYVDPEFISLGATGASYSLEMGNWNAIKTAIGDVSGTTGSAVASISFPISGGPRPGDVLAGFSSRGPTSFGTLKPDVSAPGDTILAAISPTAATGYTTVANQPATRVLYGTISGTSMASPHVAGSAALVRQVHEDWTPMEVKSALMSTAKTAMTLSNGDSANPNQRGAGRIDPSLAARAGLVFNETMANFQAANPATNGHPETLNLASYYHTSCIGSCAFPRTARTTGTPATWTISVSGLPAGSYSLSAPSFTLGSSGTFTYTLTVDSSQLTNGQWYYGDVTLTPDTKASDTIFKNGFDSLGASAGIVPQHLPIAIRGGTPRLAADQTAINASVTAGQSTTQNLVISNQGNPTLNWSITPTGGTLKGTIVSRKSTDFGLTDRTVVTAGTTTAIESTNTSNAYGADWFQIYGSGTTLADLEMEGFTSTGDPISAVATQFAWRVWADNANAPNGRPGNTVAGDQPPVWQYPSAAGGLPPTGAGMSYTTNGVRLSLADAGTSSPPLNAGRYWLNMAPSISGTGTIFYTLLAQVPGKTPSAKYALPNNATAANKAWRDTTLAALGGAGYNGYGMTVAVNAACGASWLSYSSTSGSLGAGGTSPVTVTVDASALSAGTYTAYLCISGNGTSPAYLGEGGDSLLLPVTFTVTAPPTFTVTPSVSGGNGSITPATAQTVNQGATAAFTLTPDSGFQAGPVTGTCGGSLSGNVYTTNAVTADCTVIASFQAAQVAPTATVAFSPTSVASGGSSTLTITLANANATAATLSADLVDTLPAGLTVAATPNESTTCTGGAGVSAIASGTTVTLGTGAQIPANGSCTVKADVQATAAGAYTNTLPAGALQTSAGNNAAAASDNLVVTGTFPAPYCTVTYGSDVEPVTSVVFTGISNTSSATVNGTPALENFTAVSGGAVAPRGGYTITLKGNSAGDYINFYRVYFDWNHDGVFNEDESERYDAGSITNSTGTDAKTTGTMVIVPPTAKPGLTRMRVSKSYGSYGEACGENGYGQSEDYMVLVDTSLVPPPVPALVAKSFAPNYLATPGLPSTLTITLTNYNSGDLPLTAMLTDTFPAGLVVAATPNASTTCIGGTVTAVAGAGSISLNSGAAVPDSATCTVSVDVTSASAGIYQNTIPAGAAQTANGGSPNPASATVQVASPTGLPNYSVGFESPFNGSAAGTTLNNQQSWVAQGTNVVTTTTPARGLQVARLTSTANGGTTGTQPLVLSPELPVGTSPYSSLSANIRMTRTTNGATWEFDPQDSSQGLVTTRLQFNRTGNAIQVLDFDAGTYTTIGTWTADTYFNMKVVVERATGAIEVCKDGVSLFTDATGNSVAGVNITDLAVLQVAATGQTASNTILFDDVVIDNPATGGCGGSPVAPSVAAAVSPTAVGTGASSTLTLTLVNRSEATAATLTAPYALTLPAGLTVSDTTAATTCTSGSLTSGTTVGDTTVTLATGSQIPANNTCTITVPVAAAATGTFTTTAGPGLLITNLGTNVSTGTAALTVGNPHTITKAFSPSTITAGGTSTMTITLTNNNASSATMSTPFVDTFPSGLVVANPSGAAVSGCTGSGNLTATAGSGSISLPVSRTLAANATACTITVNVTAANSGSYVNTIAAGALQTNRANNTVPVSATLTVNPLVTTHTVTPSVSGGNGSISPNTAQTVNDGDTTSFTLTPDSGYHIDTVGGTCGGSLSGNSYTTAAVTADCTVVASFAINTWTVTPSVSGGNGSISPATAQTVNQGSTSTFTLTPDSGYQIDTVAGTCGGTLTGNSFETNAVTADCTVVASFAAMQCTTGFAVEVKATGGDVGPTGYTTVKGAFDAINAGTHTGALDVAICGDTTETASAALNASGSGSSSYTAATIKPAGGAARTVSGAIAAGSSLINLNGADNVTIDGLNTGGNSLTLSNTTASSTAGTSTIRFIEGATGNTVTNTTILGSATGATTAATGTVLFHTSTVAGGNSNNTVSNNDIGPAGANLPAKAVQGLGTSAANANANNTISGNKVHDFFAAGASNAGISVYNFNTGWTIANNRIYQTATRTFATTALRYTGILIDASSAANGGNAFQITGNVIGFGAADGTGITTITGSSNEFRGILLNASGATTPSTVQGNTVSGINQSSSRASTTTASSIFIGIEGGGPSIDAPVNILSNTIGSLDGTSAIVINASSTAANTAPAIAILDFNFASGLSVSGNAVGAVTINQNGGVGTLTGFRGILSSTTTGIGRTISNNTIGGPTAAGGIVNNLTGGVIYGIHIGATNITAMGNMVQNITNNCTTAGTVAVAGLLTTGSTGANMISQNTFHSLVNNAGTINNSIYALYTSFGAASGSVVERNFVHSLMVNSTALTSQIAGILPVAGGGTYKNNMVRLGYDAAGNSITSGIVIYGMFEIAGTNNIYNNSVYVGGTDVVSSSNTFAFVSNVTTGTRNYVDNIFWNARSNASGTATNTAGSLSAATGATSDYNDLYANGIGGVAGPMFTGLDVNSIAVDPLFVAPTGTSATLNLHLQAGSPVIGVGTPIASVTDDFDGDARSATTPSIGADE